MALQNNSFSLLVHSTSVYDCNTYNIVINGTLNDTLKTSVIFNFTLIIETSI